MRSRFFLRPDAVPRPTRAARKLVGLCLLVLLTGCTTPTSPDVFDSDGWKSQRGVSLDRNKRTTMTAGIENVVRLGMTRLQVHAVLGDPDGVREAEDTDIYHLGRSPYGVDYDTYEFVYRDGELISYTYRQG